MSAIQGIDSHQNLCLLRQEQQSIISKITRIALGVLLTAVSFIILPPVLSIIATVVIIKTIIGNFQRSNREQTIDNSSRSVLSRNWFSWVPVWRTRNCHAHTPPPVRNNRRNFSWPFGRERTPERVPVGTGQSSYIRPQPRPFLRSARRDARSQRIPVDEQRRTTR